MVLRCFDIRISNFRLSSGKPCPLNLNQSLALWPRFLYTASDRKADDEEFAFTTQLGAADLCDADYDI